MFNYAMTVFNACKEYLYKILKLLHISSIKIAYVFPMLDLYRRA